MRNPFLMFGLLAAAAMLPRLGAGTVPELFGVTQTGSLFTIDPVTAAVTPIGTIAGTPSIMGIATSNNHLYGLDRNSGNVLEIDPTNAAILNTINIAIGASAVNEGDITFDGGGANFNGSGNLYIESAAFPTQKFYSGTLTNSTTGTNSLIKTCGANPCPSGEGRVFFDGTSFIGTTLYGFQQGGGGLYTINTATGVPTLANSITGLVNSGANGGLTTRPSDNQLFAVLSNTAAGGAELYTLALTGIATPVGVLGTFDSVSGLAWVNVQVVSPPTPEPSTWVLMGLGLVGLFVRRVRRK